METFIRQPPNSGGKQLAMSLTLLFNFCVWTEKATNPRNTYEDWEFIMAFCDGVNADLQG